MSEKHSDKESADEHDTSTSNVADLDDELDARKQKAFSVLETQGVMSAQ